MPTISVQFRKHHPCSSAHPATLVGSKSQRVGRGQLNEQVDRRQQKKKKKKKKKTGTPAPGQNRDIPCKTCNGHKATEFWAYTRRPRKSLNQNTTTGKLEKKKAQPPATPRAARLLPVLGRGVRWRAAALAVWLARLRPALPGGRSSKPEDDIKSKTFL